MNSVVGVLYQNALVASYKKKNKQTSNWLEVQRNGSPMIMSVTQLCLRPGPHMVTLWVQYFQVYSHLGTHLQT